MNKNKMEKLMPYDSDIAKLDEMIDLLNNTENLNREIYNNIFELIHKAKNDLEKTIDYLLAEI